MEVCPAGLCNVWSHADERWWDHYHHHHDDSSNTGNTLNTIIRPRIQAYNFATLLILTSVIMWEILSCCSMLHLYFSFPALMQALKCYVSCWSIQYPTWLIGLLFKSLFCDINMILLLFFVSVWRLMAPVLNPSKSLKIMGKYPKYWKAHLTQEAKTHHNTELRILQSISSQ